MLEVRAAAELGCFTLDVSFSMGSEVFALLGKSGSGKTLTLNMVAGFMEPEAGRIEFNGSVLFDSSAGTHVRPEKRMIGYVLQEPYLFPHCSVLRNLVYGRRGRRKGASRTEEVIEVLDLEGLVHRSPRTLSGGEKQRVAIGRALLSSPEILLMDEPVSSLEDAAKWRILHYIRKIHSRFGIPILYVTHSVDEVEFLADSIALLKNGSVAARGPKERLLRSESFFATAFSRRFTNLFRAKVVSSSAGTGISTVEIGEKTFRIPYAEAKAGDAVVVSVPSSEIIIAKEHPIPMSAQNIYCGVVQEVFPAGRSAFLLVDAGFDLFVEIGRDGLRELNITVGDRVHYILKAESMQVHTAG